MGAKRFVTSTPPAKIKGGLDAITSQSLYAVQGGKGRRNHKKQSKRLNPVGGDERVVNSWSKTPAGCKASTVVKQATEVEFETTINKVKVTLFDESTYTDAMKRAKAETFVKNQNQGKRRHKIKTVSKGYMASLPKTSGRRVIHNNASSIKKVGTL